MKQCTKCLETKPFSEFCARRDASSGYTSHCKPCRRATANRKWATYTDAEKAERRATWQPGTDARIAENQAYVKAYLETHPCVDCGESDWVVLEFDHVRGEKRRNLSYMITRGFSMRNLLDEIAKCEVRCANCHKRVTHQRAGTWRVSA